MDTNIYQLVAYAEQINDRVHTLESPLSNATIETTCNSLEEIIALRDEDLATPEAIRYRITLLEKEPTAVNAKRIQWLKMSLPGWTPACQDSAKSQNLK